MLLLDYGIIRAAGNPRKQTPQRVLPDESGQSICDLLCLTKKQEKGSKGTKREMPVENKEKCLEQ